MTVTFFGRSVLAGALALGLLAISARALIRPADHLLPASGATETRGTRSLQQQHR